MTTHRWTSTTAGIAAAGGMAWLMKLAVITVTDGRVTSTGAAAVFFVLGVALLIVGAACVPLRLLRPQRRSTTALAVLLAPVTFFASFVLLEALAKPLIGDAGPSWLADEAGILVTAVAWLGIGLTVLRAEGAGSLRPTSAAVGASAKGNSPAR